MKLCQVCGQTIRPGEAYRQHDHLSASGAGQIFYVHTPSCPGPNEQQAPDGPAFQPGPYGPRSR
jgi:hypothetical protein